MTEIIATVGPMIASPLEINKLVRKNVVNYSVNYGLKKNSLGYLNLLHAMKEEDQIPLKIYLELPGSRCRHMKKTGEIIEDGFYMLYDENAEIVNEKNYLVMSGLYDIIDDLAIGEKIYYEDGLCICSIKQIDKDRKRLLISCDKTCDANSVISEGSSVSFDGIDKNYKIIRQEDREFLAQLKKTGIVPDYFLISFCKIICEFRLSL